VRDLSYELNPSIVERTGLQFALDRLAGRFRKASTARSACCSILGAAAGGDSDLALQNRRAGHR